MSNHQVSRTLLKSPPELWAECSDGPSLARHLDDFFGEIRITRIEPERTVAWEGERVSGTVRLEPSGWGTKVTLTATGPETAPASEPETPPSGSPGTDTVTPGLPRPLTVAVEPIVIASALQPSGAPQRSSIAPPQPPDPEPQFPGPAPEPIRFGLIGRIRYLLSAREPEPTRALASEPADEEPEPSRPEGSAPAAPAPEPESSAPEPESSAPEPESPVSETTASEPEPTATTPEAEAVLSAALDSLGGAHHRPFSRA